MSADKLDIHNANPVGDGHDQAVIIAFDVEHDPVVLDEAGATVPRLDVLRASPARLAGLVGPSLQRLLGLRMLLPEFAKGSCGDDFHGLIIVPYWDLRKGKTKAHVLWAFAGRLVFIRWKDAGRGVVWGLGGCQARKNPPERVTFSEEPALQEQLLVVPP